MKMKYPGKWTYQITNTNDLKTTMRAHLTSETEAAQWVKEYSILNNTCWNVGNYYANNKTSTRYLFHKRWICHHSKYNKTPGSRRCTFCEASIDIYIKVMTKSTRYKDAFLKMTPPLRAIITISSVHNHDTESTESLQLLRAADDTKRVFAGYFDRGLPVITAIRLHQATLRATNSSEKCLANRSINPTRNMIYYWNALHRAGKLKHSDVQSKESAEEKDLSESEGTVQEEMNEEIREGDLSTDISPSFIPPVNGKSCDEQPADSDSSIVQNLLPLPRKKTPYSCEECNKAFKHKDNFTRHMATKHDSPERPYSCQICSKTFLHKSNFYSHMASHVEPPAGSGERTVDPRTLLKSHEKREIAGGGRVVSKAEWAERVDRGGPLGCRKCRDGFVREEDLAAHVLTHAAHVLPAPAQLELRCGPRAEPGRPRAWQLPAAVTGRATEDDDGQFAGDDASGRRSCERRRGAGIEARRFDCRVPGCGKRYSRNKLLKEHIMSHFPVRSYPCAVCGETSCGNGACSLKKYKSVKYGKRTLLTCMFCSALFTLSSQRDDHMRSHTNELVAEINGTNRSTVHLEHIVEQEAANLLSESSSVLADAEVEDVDEQSLVAGPVVNEKLGPQPSLPASHLAEPVVSKIEEMTNIELRPLSQALGNSYPCNICNKSFCRKCYFSKHGSVAAPLTCGPCSSVPTLRCEREKHVESHTDELSGEMSGSGSEVDVDYIEEQEMTYSQREKHDVLVDTKEFEEQEMTYLPWETPGVLMDTKEFEEQEMTHLPRETPGVLVDTKESEELLRVTRSVVEVKLEAQQLSPMTDFLDSVVDIKEEITVGDEEPGTALHDEFCC